MKKETLNKEALSDKGATVVLEEIIKTSMSGFVEGKTEEQVLEDVKDGIDLKGLDINVPSFVVECHGLYLKAKDDKASDKKILATIEKAPIKTLKKYASFLVIRDYIETITTMGYNKVEFSEIEKEMKKKEAVPHLRGSVRKIARVARDLRERGKTLEESKDFVNKYVHTKSRVI